jgi:hypothetical protein
VQPGRGPPSQTVTSRVRVPACRARRDSRVPPSRRRRALRPGGADSVPASGPARRAAQAEHARIRPGAGPAAGGRALGRRHGSAVTVTVAGVSPDGLGAAGLPLSGQ